MWTREQLLPLARSNPEALVDIILALQEEVRVLQLANQQAIHGRHTGWEL